MKHFAFSQLRLTHLVFFLLALSFSAPTVSASRYGRYNQEVRFKVLYGDLEQEENEKQKRQTNIIGSFLGVSAEQKTSEMKEEFQRFFESFQMTLFANSAERLADLVTFPLQGPNDLFVNILDRQAFIENYSSIFNQPVRLILFNKEAQDAKFADGRFVISVKVPTIMSHDLSFGEYQKIEFSFEKEGEFFKLVSILIVGP